jgi:DNA-binding response OmpR family regulator
MLPNLPIIAVTAQVSESMRQECLAAGMKDVVAKPVKPEMLFSALSRVLGVTQPVHALRELFSGERLAHLLKLMAQEFRAAKADVATAVQKQDLETIGRVRHKLHSAIEQLQLHELSKSFAALRQGDWSAASSCLHELESAASQCEVT